jgi:hypothetical protein
VKTFTSILVLSTSHVKALIRFNKKKWKERMFYRGQVFELLSEQEVSNLRVSSQTGPERSLKQS